MILMAQAFQIEEHTKIFNLSENILFITETRSVNEDAEFLFPTFKFNNYSLLFLNGDMFGNRWV